MSCLTDSVTGSFNRNFYGWSYGTVVGQYLHAIFPDRVGSVVIDGVCDSLNWVHTPQHLWGRSDFLDSEKTLQAFYDECAIAGPERCALASGSKEGKSAKDMAREVDAMLDKLLKIPLEVNGGLLYSNDVKGYMFGNLYRPRSWGDFALVRTAVSFFRGVA